MTSQDQGDCQPELIVAKATSDLRWSPDGTKLALASYAVDVTQCITDAKVEVIDASSGAVLRSFQAGNAVVASLAWNSSSTELATGDSKGVLRRWNVLDEQLLATYQVSDLALLDLSWHPNDLWIASAGHDNQIRILDTSTGQIINSATYESEGIFGLERAIVWLSWSPDGNRIASGSVDGAIRIWNSVTLSLISTIQINTTHPANAAWHPSGSQIAVVDDATGIKVIDVQSGATIQFLQGHQGQVNAVTWNPQGSLLASTSWDATVRVWNGATGQQLVMFQPQAVEETLHIDWSSRGTVAYGAAVNRDSDSDIQPNPVGFLLPSELPTFR